MAKFIVEPANTQLWYPPFITLTATDTTPLLSGVSGWNWYFNGTYIASTSSWSHIFFDPIDLSTLTLYVCSPYGTDSSVQYISIPNYPLVPHFEILPSSAINIGSNVYATPITAIDRSPSVSAISAWNWYFNDVHVSSLSSWTYTFFDPCTGILRLSVQTPYSSGIDINPVTFTITRNIENACQHEPVVSEGYRGSTTLTPIITSYELLSHRLKYQLGWPVTNIEMCDDQVFDFINQAIEWYSKYAGFTEEYLVFDAQKVYKGGLGIKLDEIFSTLYQLQVSPCARNTTHSQTFSAQFYDCDLNCYRKVVDTFSLDTAEFTGTDTLFTMDYLFAQQTYFSYMLGSFGFDLITWHVLKDWLNLREKLFATKPYVRFDPRTQYLKLIPEPTSNNNFIGIVGCRVERAIADLVRERWVHQYALALTKIAIAHARGKFGGVVLFGGGSPAFDALMSQGITEKEKLEKELMESFGEVEPPLFFIG